MKADVIVTVGLILVAVYFLISVVQLVSVSPALVFLGFAGVALMVVGGVLKPRKID